MDQTAAVVAAWREVQSRPFVIPEEMTDLAIALDRLADLASTAREDLSSPERCGRCQGTDMAHLGTGYYECRGCGHGWDGPHTDAPADIR